MAHSWDLGKFWHENLPYQLVCTAETQAYLNFASVTMNHMQVKPENWKKDIEWVRTYLNPYREWIGAQIRVDGYAYGAMFFSALISAAFVEKDIDKLIEIGLSEIPNNYRLYHNLKKATVESIMGALVGEKNIPKKWSKPLNDTLYSAIPGFHPIAISECAQRSYNVFNKIRNSSSS
ncbi:hypothetical protein [Clostridium sp.]|uniref:hypothetical protein n=1 Tax=Clostridium sp. TaxID=1506 RepID=UPI0026248EA9|nr:hypothetical protein [uncultured Clostridium sp.]